MTSIYDYTDYRVYLKDWFETAKEKNRYLSYRYLSRKTGVDSGYLVRVLQGSKHLAEKSLDSLAEVMDLSAQEKRYFVELVLFNKAKSNLEIKDRYNRLMALREIEAKVLNRSETRYFSKWYIPALRLSMLNTPFRGDFEELAQRTIPPISVAEAQEAVALLEELELIAPREGEWEVLDTHLSTGDAWTSYSIREFQREMLQKAADSFHFHNTDRREVSSLSLAIPREEIATLKQMMADFRKEVAKWALSLDDSDCVMQFNLSCFPLSHPDLNPEKPDTSNSPLQENS